MKEKWTDKDWVCLFFNTNDIDETRKCMEAFRAEVLKEAEENTWNWLIGLSSDNFPMSREKLHSAILGDHVPGVTKMIDLDPAVQDAVQKNFGKLIDPPPPDILMDARQDKLHVDPPGRRAVKAVFRPDTEKIGPAIQALLQENNHGIDCPTCAESVDGQPGNGACQQCREEDER